MPLFGRRPRANVDHPISTLGKNYATAPHCEQCGWEPKQQANYGLMLAQLRLHKERQHGQKRGESKRKMRPAESYPY